MEILSRDTMIAEIHAAFQSVSREGGVSWRESAVIDMYGNDEHATFKDTDTNWSQLVDDLDWDVDSGIGGFCFLDAIGFRYYLPVAMIRCIHRGYDAGISIHLMKPNDEFADHAERQRSLLDERQRECVAKFLVYMASLEGPDYSSGPYGWIQILNSCWRQGSGDSSALLSDGAD